MNVYYVCEDSEFLVFILEKELVSLREETIFALIILCMRGILRSDRQRSLLNLHIAILFFGFTAVLGGLITMDAVPLVWWRLILALIAFVPVLLYRKVFNWASFVAFKKQIVLVGLFLALHWVAFFLAVKLGNASIAVLCIASASFMTAVVEPLITRRPFSVMELIFGLMIVPGMFLVISSVDASMIPGVVSGLVSALFASLFTIYNKSIVGKGSTVFFTFVELLFAFIFLSILILGMDLFGHRVSLWPVPETDWKYLVFLAVICTTLSYTLAFDALKQITAFMANLSVNLEPLYGIVLAALLLNEYEELNITFYVGAVLILLLVVIFPIFELRISRHKLKKKDVGII